jgi:hypothetical protein
MHSVGKMQNFAKLKQEIHVETFILQTVNMDHNVR